MPILDTEFILQITGGKERKQKKTRTNKTDGQILTKPEATLDVVGLWKRLLSWNCRRTGKGQETHLPFWFYLAVSSTSPLCASASSSVRRWAWSLPLRPHLVQTLWLRRLFLDSHMTTNYCTFRAATAQAPANELPFNDHLRPKLGLRGHRTRDGPSLLTVQQHQGLHIAQCSTEVPSLLGCGVF